MLGDYSEFENVCKVLVCNELAKCFFGVCLMMFQHVSHSSCARHLPATTVHHNVILVSIHVNAAGNGTKWLNATGWSCMLPLFVQVTAFAKICC